MYKIVLSLTIATLILVGCTSENSLMRESKEVVTILDDYMRDGKEINESQQKQIDKYASDYELNSDSLSEDDKLLMESVLELNSTVFYYNSYEKSTDRENAMSTFVKQVNTINQILK